MLKNGWDVLAVDSDAQCRQNIEEGLDEKFKDKITVQVTDFNKSLVLEPESAELVVAFNSLYFMHPEKSEEIMEKILGSIKPGGCFIGNFLGINDEWKLSNNSRSYFSLEEIQELFKDFTFIKKDSYEFDGITAKSKRDKHWHKYLIVAIKKTGRR